MHKEGEYNPEEEKQPQYKAVIVLGAGFVEHVDKRTGESRKILSEESRLRATASGILVDKLDIPTIIYSGGMTGGLDNPSEARAMYEYALKIFPELEHKKIILEEESYDTSTNAEFVSREARVNNIDGPVILLSSASHLERADYFFLQHGVDATPVAAESVVAERSEHHREYIRKKLESLGNLKSEAIESILKILLVFDPKGIIPQKIAENTKYRGAVGDY